MTYALLAQDPAAPAQGGGKQQQEVPFFLSLPFMMLMIGLFFLVVILPQSRRQRREQQQMLANIKRGTKVVTNGGIIGTVVSVKENEDEVTLRSEDAKIKVLKSSIFRVLGQDENEAK
jgi:preprotein translocase subunit YajC